MDRETKRSNIPEDRLSTLPDSLLCHILSFLPTKLSVATTVLSTRYNRLWRDVVNLDFNAANHKKRPTHKMCFEDIINRVIMQSNVRELNSFRLILKDATFNKAHLLETWIGTIVARNVKVINLQMCHQVSLPYCLFSCKTVVDLRLDDCVGIIPDSVCLPNLKKLYLENFQYGSDEKFQSLISGCPVLQGLYVKRISKDLKVFTVSSPTLKWLTLKFKGPSRGGDDFSDYMLVINTPAVRYLALKDNISQQFVAGMFNSLVEAKICLYNHKVTQNVHHSSMLEFVEKLCHVKCLKLSLYYYQFPDSLLAAATWRFSNLTRLEFAADWHFLLKLLGSADNLKVLTISEIRQKALKRWAEPKQVAKCLLSNLRQVKVSSFECLEAEFKMIRYILKHGQVLNMMKVYAKDIGSDTAKLDALRRITEFERESKTCKLKFF